MAKSKRKKLFGNLKLPKFFLGLTLGLAGLIVLLGGFSIVYTKRSLPNLKIGQINVGNKTQAELEQIFSTLELIPINVNIKDQVLTIKPEEIELQYDARASSAQIINLTSLENLLQLKFLRPQSLSFNYNTQKLENIISSFAAKIDLAPQQPKIVLKKDKLEIEGQEKIGEILDQTNLIDLIISKIGVIDFSSFDAKLDLAQPEITKSQLSYALPQLEKKLNNGLDLDGSGEKFTVEKAQLLSFLKPKLESFEIVFNPDEEKIKAYVKTLAKQINQTVKDAQLKMVDGRVEIFQPSAQGRKLDQDKTLGLLIDAISKNKTKLTLPVFISEPQVTTAAVNDLGIQEIIGKGTTSFKGSPENRKHNINQGATVLRGILIAPGQEFSTIAALGNPDSESGYLPELVIRENKTTPEFGGGLCQVSTTLYRAVLNAGLPIVERQNHSWRISYYEPPVGLDATIYFPRPDLKFKNDTPGWILIQSKIEGVSLTFEIFGTKDGRRSEISTKTLSTTRPPEAVYVQTDTLAKGETKQVEKPHPGGSAIATYKVYDKDGKIINEQTFSSRYKAVPARFLVGTAEPAAAQTPPPPTQQGQVAGEQSQPPAPTPEATPAPTPAPTPPQP